MSYTFHTNFIHTLHLLYTFHSHFIRTLHTLHSNITSQQILDTHFTATSQQHQTYFTHTYIHFTTTTSYRTSRMFEVVSMCEGCCEVFGEVYWTACIFLCCEFLWVFQIYNFLFKDTVRSVCAEEIRKVSVSVQCFSELCVKHILLHTLQLFIYIYIIIFSAGIWHQWNESEFLWVFQIYYFLFKDMIQSVCVEEIRKVSVSVRCFSELCEAYSFTHTSTFYIYIIIFSADT